MREQFDKWDRRYLELAKHVAQWSKDPSTKVGAVVVDPFGSIVGIGYNGFPVGVKDTDERLNDRETKYKMVVHAEVNAILQAGPRARGASLYVWPAFMIPNICHECTKVAIQAGVAEVVGYDPSPEFAERAARWTDSINAAKTMLDEANVEYFSVPEASANDVVGTKTESV